MPTREWIGARVPFPGYVMEGGPYRPDVILWMELPEGLIVGTTVTDPRQPVSSVEHLRATMAAPAVGPPRRPDRVRVADAAFAAELHEAVPGVEVVVAPTPEIDDALESLRSAMAADPDDESYLGGGAIAPSVVADLFTAAEILWVTAPWRTADDEQVLRIDMPALNVSGWCLSIIGALGEQRGILLFESYAAFATFLRAGTSAKSKRPDLGSRILSLSFERGADLPDRMRREAARHGWRIAGPDAYPRPQYWDRDVIGVPLRERELRILTAVATSLTAFCAKHSHVFTEGAGEPVCESWYDEDDVEVRITAPYHAHDLFEIAPPPRRATSSVGRNDPCPCSSGRKYKKCCLANDEAERRAAVDPLVEAVAPTSDPTHALDQRLVVEMLAHAHVRFPRAWRQADKDFADPEGTASLAVPWAVYGVRVEGHPVVHWFLRQPPRRLLPEERTWLTAQLRAWLSVWEVVEVDPGAGMTLVDLLSGETRRVREASASRDAVVRDVLLGRVVDHGGVALICGLHPHPLPPIEAAALVRRARTRLRCRTQVPAERLREEETGRYLIGAWERAQRALQRRRAVPPHLTNTDGDEILLTTDRFVFDPAGRDELVARLTAMAGDSASEDDARGATHLCFLRAGNAMHAAWENTVVANACIESDELRLETNSVRRADDLRRDVESACRDLVRFRNRTHTDPRDHPPGEPEASPPTPPEARELLRAFKERHYADWIDQSLPALRGRTPRAAAHTATGRAELEALLKHMEHGENQLPPAERYDFATIRRTLGLP